MPGNDGTLQIIYLHGMREKFDKSGCLIKMATSEGRFLIFKWQEMKLNTVADMQNATVLTFDYSSSPGAVKILHPSGNLNMEIIENPATSVATLAGISIADKNEVAMAGIKILNLNTILR